MEISRKTPLRPPERKGVTHMGGRKTAGIVLLVVGIIVLVLSLFADTFGLGGSASIFGPYQIAGTILGAIVTVVGLVLTLRG